MKHMMRAYVLPIVLAPLACSGSSTATDGAPGTADAAHAAIDALRAFTDAGPPFSCAETVGAYCAMPTICIRSFADVPTCGPPLDGPRTCDGGGHAFVVGGVDTSRTYYYDASGDLVAIVDFILGHFMCTAGPGMFTPPICGDVAPLPRCDAGP